MVKKVFLYFSVMCGVFSEAKCQPDKNTWVDSVFNSLSPDETLGQIFMVAVPSHASDAAIDKIENQIKSKEIGGIIFSPQGPIRQVSITNQLQAASAIPLLVAQDIPQGVGQSRDSTVVFPNTSLVGAAKNDSMAYVLGKEIARQMKILGVHMNIASFAEVAHGNFPDSTLRHSFGQNSKRVAAKAVAFMRGLQDHGVLAVAKNFTINGATVLDTQDHLPLIEASVDTLKALPYYKLFENHLAGVMPASSSFPIVFNDKSDNRKNDFNASDLSLFFTGAWLQRKYTYQGLTLANVQGQPNGDEKSKGDAELIAFQAGNDLIVGSEDIGAAIRKIKRLIKKDENYKVALTSHVRRILAAKYDAGLWKKPTLTADNLMAKLNNPEAHLVSQKLYEAAITVVQDKQNVIPIATLENRHFIYINTTPEPPGEFYQYLNKYVHTTYFTLSDRTNVQSFTDSLVEGHVIVVGIFPETSASVLQKMIALAQKSASRNDVILCDFGNKAFLRDIIPAVTVITAYTDVDETRKAVPQVIFGGLKADGILPFSTSGQITEGMGIETEPINRLTYSIPEDAGMRSGTLAKIESIVDEAISSRATPGCQILVARNGKVIYDKSFGGLTYDTISDSVSDDILYDLASLTKVSATLQAVMFLYEKGLIDLNKKLSFYLPELKKTNKKDITLLEMLTHQAGLVPFIPMWNQTVKDTVFLPQYYSRSQNEKYPLQVSPNLYGAPVLRDSVWSWIEESKLQTRPPRTPYGYQYSDLGFLLLQRVAEKIFNQPIDEFLSQNLYEPLGAYTTGFTPLKRFPVQQIAPTEDDKIYRKTHIAGTVHDERAAMMGGVAGHAGLFSNATDLAKLSQMLLQKGSYGGYRYYKTETINLFTAKQFDKSRRGLGWDKPVQSDWSSPTSIKASPKTFGHTGFTGTCIWIDPEFNLVYIFLSNRVYPDRSAKLITTNIRSRIQDVIYESIFDFCRDNSL